MVDITYISNLEAVAVAGSEAEADVMERHFRKKVPGSEWIVRKRGGFGCFHFRFWNRSTGSIGRGLVPEMKRLLKENGMQYRVDKNGFESKGESLTAEQIAAWSETLMNGKYKMRPDQAEAAAMCLRHKQLVCQLPTGFGKSMVIYAVARRMIDVLGRNVILIVPSKQLASQMSSDFKDYGWEGMDDFVEIMHGEAAKPSFKKSMLISTWQSLQKYPASLLGRYKCLMVDEVHHGKGSAGNFSKLHKIIKNCSMADYRLGFTGTMPPDEHDSFMVQSNLGPAHAPVSYTDMKEMGILSDCSVMMVRLDYSDEARKKWSRRGYIDEIRFLEENPARCEAILNLVRNLPEGQNTLVMFSHTRHLDFMLECFKNSGFGNVKVIKGETKVAARESVRAAAEAEEGVTVFATYGCVQEGVNIKKLHNIVLASSSKSEIRVLQTIGRGLRTHASKEKAAVWDIVDDLSLGKFKNYALNQAAKRFDYYQEQGFNIEHRKISGL